MAKTKAKKKMLNEKEIIKAVCRYLKSRGWQIDRTALPTEHGHDIEANRAGCRMIIEAKGGTSCRKQNGRYGKPFNTNQESHSVAAAFYSAAVGFQNSRKHISGIALPLTARNKLVIGRIGLALKKLRIPVFWVDEKKKVI